MEVKARIDVLLPHPNRSQAVKSQIVINVFAVFLYAFCLPHDVIFLSYRVHDNNMQIAYYYANFEMGFSSFFNTLWL